MSNQLNKSDLITELSSEEQQFLSGGQQPYTCYFCRPLGGYGGYGGYSNSSPNYGGGYGRQQMF
jgi:hypothetical protein